MRTDILRFIKKIKERYKVEALYFPDNDVYSVRFRGRAVQNFNSKQFYDIPKEKRFRMIGDILHLGLSHNIGERTMINQLYLQRGMGKKI